MADDTRAPFVGSPSTCGESAPHTSEPPTSENGLSVVNIFADIVDIIGGHDGSHTLLLIEQRPWLPRHRLLQTAVKSVLHY